MDRAWLKHCASITKDKLTSAAACEEHVEQFELQVLADGLRGSVLDDCDDVQALIAAASSKSTKGDVSVGLRALAVAGRDFRIQCIVDDIVELAKRKAVRGHYGMVIRAPYAEIKSYHQAELAQLGLMPRICAALKEVGLYTKVCDRRLTRSGCGPGDLIVSWLGLDMESPGAATLQAEDMPAIEGRV
jgi:hypothetical protein